MLDCLRDPKDRLTSSDRCLKSWLSYDPWEMPDSPFSMKINSVVIKILEMVLQLNAYNLVQRL